MVSELRNKDRENHTFSNDTPLQVATVHTWSQSFCPNNQIPHPLSKCTWSNLPPRKWISRHIPNHSLPPPPFRSVKGFTLIGAKPYIAYTIAMLCPSVEEGSLTDRSIMHLGMFSWLLCLILLGPISQFYVEPGGSNEQIVDKKTIRNCFLSFHIWTWNFTLTLGYLNPTLNNPALVSKSTLSN